GVRLAVIGPKQTLPAIVHPGGCLAPWVLGEPSLNRRDFIAALRTVGQWRSVIDGPSIDQGRNRIRPSLSTRLPSGRQVVIPKLGDSPAVSHVIQHQLRDVLAPGLVRERR